VATIQKNFRFNEEMLKKFNKLKENEKLTSDTDFLRKMIEYTELMQEMKKSKVKTVPLEEYKELQRQYQALLVELGRLKGLLEQKKELPKKKHWWQFW
jgi:hypothetical protein